MARFKRLGVAVLAAGASRRFGDADKLAAEFRGKMLGEHAVCAIPAHLFEKCWVVASIADHPCAESWNAAGFEIIENTRAKRGMGTSVALAAWSALHNHCDGLMIALADMPFVPSEHYTALVGGLLAPDAIVASSNYKHRLPPAIFGGQHLERLSRMRGDEGARALLRNGTSIVCPQDWLIDIDTPEALRKYGQD